MGTRHKHADVIHAWAEGEEVEWYDPVNDKWYLVVTPNNGMVCWGLTAHEYRIKPKIVKRGGWMNIYDYHDASIWPSKEEADSRANSWRKACVRIEWEEEV